MSDLVRSAASSVVSFAASKLSASVSYAKGVYMGQKGFTSLQARNPLEKVFFRLGGGSLVYMMRIRRGLARVGARVEGVSVQEYERRRDAEAKAFVRRGMSAAYAGAISAAKQVRRV